MRNTATLGLGSEMTSDYKRSGLMPNSFMKTVRDAFDITPLTGMGYASFHQVVHGTVMQFYYYADRDAWCCKQ